MNFDKLVESMIKEAQERGEFDNLPGEGKPIDLTAGLQKRDFTYVEDVVEGLLRLGTVWTTSAGMVNVATGQLYTVRHFIETAAQILGIRSDNLNFGALPTRNEEMEHDPVTIRKLVDLTAWAPSTTISQGIRRTRELVDNATRKIG